MQNKKKILFFGLGSIGKRHLRLLQKNYNYEIYAYRTSRNNQVPNIINIYNIKEALKINPEIVFITNPTHLHIETAILCLEAGIKNIFIEKPLSHSLNNLDILLKKVEESGAFIYVGYSMRYNPVLKKLKKIVKERENQIFYVQTICSSYLPNWIPEKDYRTTYRTKKEMGGGIILELIHEFDYNEWLFGKIKSISGTYGKLSPLESDTEDFCDVIINFENNLRASIHLDWFSFVEKRIIKILTIDEEIIADLINNEISIFNGQKVHKQTFNFERDDYFEQQIRTFLNNVESQSKNIENLKDACELLKKLLDFKTNNKILTKSND